MDFVDVIFSIKENNVLLADHGYHMYSALSTCVPIIHKNKHIGIFSLAGIKHIGNCKIITTKDSRLIIRCPINMLENLLDLIGKKLIINNYQIYIYNKFPKIVELKGTSSLYSKFVYFKFRNIKMQEITDQIFIEKTNNELKKLNICGYPKLRLVEGEKAKEEKIGTKSKYIRRTFKNKQKKTMGGYAMYIHNLSQEDSIALQISGLGGARHFGCGMFRSLQK